MYKGNSSKNIEKKRLSLLGSYCILNVHSFKGSGDLSISSSFIVKETFSGTEYVDPHFCVPHYLLPSLFHFNETLRAA